MRKFKVRSTQAGFSLTELAVVVVILGVLALIGVPKFKVVAERSKAAEAFVYLGQIQAAQERHNARAGRYAARLEDLDVDLEFPRHFRFGSLTSFKWETHWQLRIFRAGPSGGNQAYSVCYNQDGYDPRRSSIPAKFAMGGIGGMQVPGGGVPPSKPRPSGRINWGSDTPMAYDEYVDRIFDANMLDYKKGKDPHLDLFLWLGQIGDQILLALAPTLRASASWIPPSQARSTSASAPSLPTTGRPSGNSSCPVRALLRASVLTP